MNVIFFDVLGTLIIGADVEALFKDASMLQTWNCIVLKNLAQDTGATLVARNSPVTEAELTAAVGLPVIIADPVEYLDNNTVSDFTLITAQDEPGKNYMVNWKFGITPTDAVKVKKWLDTGTP
jgi:hypothetical protein